MILPEFLTIVKKQTEPALIISANLNQEDIEGFNPIKSDFESLFQALKEGGDLVMNLSSELDRATYDLIKQYTDRKDAVSVFVEGDWKQCPIPTNTHLILLSDKDTLQNLEKEYPIRQIVGMVFEDK